MHTLEEVALAAGAAITQPPGDVRYAYVGDRQVVQEVGTLFDCWLGGATYIKPDVSFDAAVRWLRDGVKP